MLKAAILIAEGTEEMEYTITWDTLTRAGVDCRSVCVSNYEHISISKPGLPELVKCSRGVLIRPDVFFSPEVVTPDKFNLLVIPGGAKGAERLSQSSHVQHAVRQFLEKDKYVGMICAGVLTALTSGLARQPLTSHPSVKAQLDNDFEYSEDPVVVSGKLVTSRGPGTTFLFALTLVELLCGKEKRAEVAGPMIFPPNTFA
ncbi:DJ-1 [Cytidiella melzeri]|nr:DJ-1 [Cytidiella melzeri]